MACLLAPLAEAVAITVGEKIVKHTSKKEHKPNMFTGKLSWLKNMLYGGSLLLALEHIWHGEITITFPFLTAAGSEDTAMEMLAEIFTTGTLMALTVTLVWVAMCAITHKLSKVEAKKVVKE